MPAQADMGVTDEGGRGPAKFELPTSLDWYRQTVNWMVGLSTGAIAAGVTVVDRLRSQSLTAQWTFVAAGVVLLTAVALGVNLYSRLVALGNALEERARHSQRRKELQEEARQIAYTARAGEAVKIAEDEKAAVEEERELQTYTRKEQGKIGSVFDALLWVFPIGLALGAIGLGIATMSPAEVHRKWQVVATENAAAPAVMVEESTGEAWILTKGPQSTFVWRLAPRDTLIANPTGK